jgi:hypothetical protein
MRIGRGVIAFVWMVALHAGCAKGMSSGEGDDDGADTGDSTGDDVGTPDAGGSDPPDAGREDPPDAGGGGGPVTITHSSTMALEAGTAIACTSDVGNARNSWYRVFDLPAMGITGSLAVDKVTIGIEEADGDGDDLQPLTVKLHQLTGEFVVANLSELGRSRIDVSDGALQIIEVPLTASVPAGITLVAEMSVPNGQGLFDGDFLFPGANDDGQTGPTWVRSECGGSQPQDAASIGFPNFHLVLSIDAVEN